MNKLAITICATKSYAYATRAQAMAIQASIYEYFRIKKPELLEIFIIIASDGCEKIKGLVDYYTLLFKGNEKIKVYIEHLIFNNINDDQTGYKKDAQKIIATLRTATFNSAKNLNVDFCWSLDSDVIPKPNALNCMLDTLIFDDGYYSVACCPYPSQGGGSFLCGRGDPRNPILQDIYINEKIVPQKISKRLKFYDKQIKQIINIIKNKGGNEDNFKKLKILQKKVYYWNKFIDKRCPPKGNVFKLNSEQWKKRGWLDFAYPALGKGAVVPTDWCGFGCNLIKKKALNYINFHGYECKGTEDLYIIWNKWFPNNIKMAAILHCPADHVIRKRHKPNMKPSEFNGYSYILTYHEPDGECEGHLRQSHKEFIEYC